MNYIIRDDKEHETTAPKVKVIAPRKKFQPSYNDRQNREIRVGAYCRVSTDSDEQELSYETQCEYYENYIGSHENWELVAIYSDEGITGTSTNKRSDFMRMIDDARAGKLDMIITKSITRFARNTVDSLMYLRILKEYNVDVYFEVENVHSLEANEMLLTILSSGDIKGSLKKERFMLPTCMAISQTEEHLILLKKKQKLFERSFLNIFQE